MLDGELVAFNDAGAPLATRRRNPWSQRRALLEGIWRERGCARLADVFDDGDALFTAVVEYDLEGIVAKRRDGVYGSGHRGWVKVKNPAYWRSESEIEAMRRRRERIER